jgi:hypothetical protein
MLFPPQSLLPALIPGRNIPIAERYLRPYPAESGEEAGAIPKPGKGSGITRCGNDWLPLAYPHRAESPRSGEKSGATLIAKAKGNTILHPARSGGGKTNLFSYYPI